MLYYPKIKDIKSASKIIHSITKSTALTYELDISQKYQSNIFFKHAYNTSVRSYKLYGAYNAIYSLYMNKKVGGIVTCSAGNHAQGIAFSTTKLFHKNISSFIFMPINTPKQKIDRVKYFGGTVILEGETFDESYEASIEYSSKYNLDFVHPFNNKKVIEGQAVIGYEILKQMKDKKIDYIILPIGGGGLGAGVSSIIKHYSPNTKIIGVEPKGAPSLTEALKNKKPVKLDNISTFVDGASVKRIGDLNYPILEKNIDDVLLIKEGHVCSELIYNHNVKGHIYEPAGVLSVCALELLSDKIKNKNVISIISGSNSDAFRMPDFLNRALIYEGKKQYFKIDFTQKAGELKNYITSILGPHDDIILFRYTKILNQETGPVIVGIESINKEEIEILINNMRINNIKFEKIDPSLIYI